MMNFAIGTTRQITGITLILGGIVFLTGAGLYGLVKDPNGPVIFGQPPREWVRLVFEHPRLWSWATLLFIGGLLVMLVGQTLLAELLQKAGDPGFARVGLLVIIIGAVLWMPTLAFRLAVDPWVGATTARTGSMPDFYAPLGLWLGVLYSLYTILTFAGLMAYGGAIVSTNLLPHWLGWTAIIYGAGGLVMFAAVRDAPPFLHCLVPLLIGILLLIG